MFIFEEEDDRFYMKESTLKNAGKGLFAARKIKEGEFLPVTGILVRRGGIADQCTYYLTSYKFASSAKKNGNSIVLGDYSIIPLGYAGIVNHDEKLQNVEIRYCGDDYPQKSPHAGKAVYWFIRDVEKDEEIFGNYGHAWNNILHKVNEIKDAVDYEKKDWEKFLEYDLYGLNDLVN